VGYSQRMGLADVRLGDKFGYLHEVLHNTSRSPITFRPITFPRLRNVLRILQVKIAPLVPGPPSVDGGRYATDPPVMKSAQGCIVETLRRVKGFRPPRGWARIWDGVSAGRYTITRHVVTYTQDGARFRRVLPQGYEGVVTKNGTHLTQPGPRSRTSP
jgi:hypothetical protein